MPSKVQETGSERTRDAGSFVKGHPSLAARRQYSGGGEAGDLYPFENGMAGFGD